MKVNRLLAGTLALVLIAGLGTPAFAGNSVVVVPECGDMYGSVGRGGGTSNPGAVVLVSQTDGSQTFLGDPTAGTDGLSGLTFDSNGNLFGSVVFPGVSTLIEIDPVTGGLINNIGQIQDAAGAAVKISDLATQPGTDNLFGISSATNVGDLFSIDKSTALATSLGATGAIVGAIGFAPDGTLFFVPRVSLTLQTLDPSNGNVLTSVARSANIELDALGVRGDGTIFVAGTPFVGDGKDIWTIATDGTMTFIGNGVRQVADLDFLPCPVKVGGELLPIDSTALVLAGLQTSAIWMLPVLAGVAGSAFGILYIKSRRN